MFDLCGPMKGCASTQGRHLFMEGDLKFKDNINKVITMRREWKYYGELIEFLFWKCDLGGCSLFLAHRHTIGVQDNCEKGSWNFEGTAYY